MSRLLIHADPTGSLRLDSEDAAVIAAELGARGLRFERWPARIELGPAPGSPPGAATDQTAILSAYAGEVARLQGEGTYPTVDAIRLTPDHPDREALRLKFLSEHSHSEDEVRFFVEGRGLFCLHVGEEVLQVLCERNDLIKVPAGTLHWFDMGPAPLFTALRFFDNPAGWVATFSGDPIADRYPRLDTLPQTVRV